MFTKAVGTTACDWSVSDVVKTSQCIDLNIVFLFYLLQELRLAD